MATVDSPPPPNRRISSAPKGEMISELQKQLAASGVGIHESPPAFDANASPSPAAKEKRKSVVGFVGSSSRAPGSAMTDQPGVDEDEPMLRPASPSPSLSARLSDAAAMDTNFSESEEGVIRSRSSMVQGVDNSKCAITNEHVRATLPEDRPVQHFIQRLLISEEELLVERRLRASNVIKNFWIRFRLRRFLQMHKLRERHTEVNERFSAELALSKSRRRSVENELKSQTSRSDIDINVIKKLVEKAEKQDKAWYKTRAELNQQLEDVQSRKRGAQEVVKQYGQNLINLQDSMTRETTAICQRLQRRSKLSRELTDFAIANNRLTSSEANTHAELEREIATLRGAKAKLEKSVQSARRAQQKESTKLKQTIREVEEKSEVNIGHLKDEVKALNRLTSGSIYVRLVAPGNRKKNSYVFNLRLPKVITLTQICEIAKEFPLVQKHLKKASHSFPIVRFTPTSVAPENGPMSEDMQKSMKDLKSGVGQPYDSSNKRWENEMLYAVSRKFEVVKTHDGARVDLFEVELS